MRERILRAISLLTDGQIDRFDNVQDALGELRAVLEAEPEHDAEGETGSEEATSSPELTVHDAIAHELSQLKEAVAALTELTEGSQKVLGQIFQLASGNP
jgi:hypothetical protein